MCNNTTRTVRLTFTPKDGPRIRGKETSIHCGGQEDRHVEGEVLAERDYLRGEEGRERLGFVKRTGFHQFQRPQVPGFESCPLLPGAVSSFARSRSNLLLSEPSQVRIQSTTGSLSGLRRNPSGSSSESVAPGSLDGDVLAKRAAKPRLQTFGKASKPDGGSPQPVLHGSPPRH